MNPVTRDELQHYAEHALPEYVDVLLAGWEQIEAVGINTPLRWCHFISQMAHETGGFRIKRESTAWSGERMKALWPARFPLGAKDPRIMLCRDDPEKLANLAYATVAGNKGGDDGWRYRGGSFIQLTGRDNYAECGLAIGVPLEIDPELIERPEVGLSATLWEWGKHPNNEFADHNYGRTIGNAINRGNPWSSHDPIGYDSRRQWFDRAWALWGGGNNVDADKELHLGAYGPPIAQVQSRLKELGYGVGAVDGVLGPATARALAGFKLDRRRQGVDMEPDERVGPLTLAALDAPHAAPFSAERTTASITTLAQLGSTEVATGQNAKGLGQIALYTGLLAGVSETGSLEIVKSTLGVLPMLQSALVPAIAAIQWGLNNALWVGVLVGGVWLYIKGRDIVHARLEAHRSGANLGR